MKYLIPVIFLLVGCVNHEASEDVLELFPEPQIQLDIKYAKGLELKYSDSHTTIISKSLPGNEYYRDSIVLVHDAEIEIGSWKKLRMIPSSLNCQSSTHLAYIDLLKQLHLVSGVCGLDYVHTGGLKEKLIKNETKEVCLGEKVQIEPVLKTNPDLFLVYPFALSQVETLETNGIKTFMVAEYLETHPLARLEWIKFFGLLFSQEEKALDYFSLVESEYESLVQAEPDTNKRFIFNLPYGESWFTPSSNSLIVKLLEDAGLYYYYQEETGTENTVHAQEQIWSDGTKADYWVIIADRPADFNLEALKEENEVYKTFKSVKNHQVIFCNSKTSDYFLQGVIEPHIMIKDILFATHKIDQHQPKYFHLLK